MVKELKQIRLDYFLVVYDTNYVCMCMCVCYIITYK